MKSGCRKLLELLHHELDKHYRNGKPTKVMSKATCERAKLVFDQVRRDFGVVKPPEVLGGQPPVPAEGEQEAPAAAGSPLSRVRLKIAKTG